MKKASSLKTTGAIIAILLLIAIIPFGCGGSSGDTNQAGEEPGGGNNTPLATCGNSMCEDGESIASCPDDCGVSSEGPELNLPRIAWEGGPDYWKQFPMANAAGWDDPGFFPIAAWYNQFSSDAEVQFDKSLGLNTYIGLNGTTDFDILRRNGMFYIGPSLNTSFDPSSPNWVGYFLCDECELNSQQAMDDFIALRDSLPDDGRFVTSNFTQQLIGPFGDPNIWEQWVNSVDAISIDMYWYTLPEASFTHAGSYIVPVTQPRTASSYGKTVKAMRLRDASDGKLQPIWNFIENLNGGPGEGPFYAFITPGQLKGAVMSSIINEARGILYFNSSLTGTCNGNPIFRHVQIDPNDCAAEQVQAAKEINLQIQALAPVINTQSYDYSFGVGLDTMLKTYQDSAYIFAMIDGSSNPGNRTFTLPSGINGTTVTVIEENRTLPVVNGQFTDTFDYEYSYHIYRIALGSGGEDPQASLDPPAPAAAAGYTTLALDDEFDGPGLDTTVWSIGEPMGSFEVDGITYHGTWNPELEYIAASQVTVQNSTLILTAAPHAPISGPNGSRSYVSGAVSTYGKFAEQFYYAEIRAKLPAVTGSATGLWPALWLYDTSFAGNEIDMMESFGGDQTTAQAHVWAPQNRNTGTPLLSVDYAGLSGFNTYGVLKTPNTLEFYLNGELRYTCPTDYIEADSPPQALIMELKLGDVSWMSHADPSQWAGGIQGAGTADLVIDWVRVWTE